MTKNELTAFVDKVMIILKDEVEQGYLTEQEYDDYVNLFRRAAENIFEKHADFVLNFGSLSCQLGESVSFVHLLHPQSLLPREESFLNLRVCSKAISGSSSKTNSANV